MSSHAGNGASEGFAPMSIESSSSSSRPSSNDVECTILPGSPSVPTLARIALAALLLGLIIGAVITPNSDGDDALGVRGEGIGEHPRPHQSKHSTNPSKYGGSHPDKPEDVLNLNPNSAAVAEEEGGAKGANVGMGDDEVVKEKKDETKKEKKGGEDGGGDSSTKDVGGDQKDQQQTHKAKGHNEEGDGGKDTKDGSGSSSSSSNSSNSAIDEPWRKIPDPDPTLSFPRLAWLLSFPNSGTSYTMKLVQTATHHFIASNYGHHNVHKETKLSVPFFDDPKTFEDMKGRGSVGPFIADPHSKHLTRATGGYVLTKTHCGGYCFKCAPAKYTLTDESFLKHCVSGGYVYPKDGKYPKDADDDDATGVRVTDANIAYDPRLIARAIHLIRNPYDNIVSRYHLEHNHMERDGRTKDLTKYPRDRDGFRKFCFDINDRFAADEAAAPSSQINAEVLKLVKDVPCHADFFRYVNWHNHAFAITGGDMLKLPTMILHYDDYEADFDGTLGRLMDFLGQQDKGESNGTGDGDEDDNKDGEEEEEGVKEFVEGKKYAEEYFTEKERKAVRDGLKVLASEGLWEELRRYL